MHKRVAVIDIGSNSARLVIFQKTSQYGFHLVCEQKSRVRIGEGAYEKEGNLQTKGMQRAFLALESFSNTIQKFKVTKTISVATSALRDAPNRDIFLKRIKNELDIEIDVIDGKREAFFGAIAANNLLPINNGITIDIGGGSSDIALIKNNVIIDTYSLNIGTVRIKELFFDKAISIDYAKKYIRDSLQDLPLSFKSEVAIAIGGSARALAKSIMKNSSYPLIKLHAFEYAFASHKSHFNDIIYADMTDLSSLGIKLHRHDTIREGTLIFTEIMSHIKALSVITSGVGVREGVYLHSTLKKDNWLFPKKINPSIVSIKDRFDLLSIPSGNRKNILKSLYKVFSNKFDHNYLPLMNMVLSLSDIGKALTIYNKNRHAHYISMQELNYRFTHNEIILISIILYSKKNRLYHKELYKKFHSLLPSKKVVKWLGFIYSLTLILNENSIDEELDFRFYKGVLYISSSESLYLAKESISDMRMPKNIMIEIN